MRYQVVVGNVGTVIDTDSLRDAHQVLVEYKNQSKAAYGRASNETVTFFDNGEPTYSYEPSDGE